MAELECLLLVFHRPKMGTWFCFFKELSLSADTEGVQSLNKLKAPKKKYILLPKTAHGFNKTVVDAQYKVFKRIKSIEIAGDLYFCS